MAGKYLSQNCLCVEDSAAIDAVNTLIKKDGSHNVYASALNRVPHERREFLKNVKNNRR